ncbi:MAG: hypothetical protein J5J06_10360 [Phycisphaerae bacterium]|nr:hypothetical protein [Phycisphaerae bacterium]
MTKASGDRAKPLPACIRSMERRALTVLRVAAIVCLLSFSTVCWFVSYSAAQVFMYFSFGAAVVWAFGTKHGRRRRIRSAAEAVIQGKMACQWCLYWLTKDQERCPECGRPAKWGVAEERWRNVAALERIPWPPSQGADAGSASDEGG